MKEVSAQIGREAAVRELRPLGEIVADEARLSTRRRVLVGVVLALVLVAIGLVVFFLVRERSVALAERFTTAAVTRGDVHARVSATGRLEARSTVDVGTEVSGRVIEVTVDVDDAVQAGQVLVRFDPVSLQAQAEQARAGLAAAHAALNQARVERKNAQQQLARVERLHAAGIDPDQALDSARIAVDVSVARVASARAQIESQAASLAVARTTLEKAVVRAPIGGVVISREVDPGQTVAAMFQTPVLLTIAEDLTQMRVTAGIDEADIGTVEIGQRATFTVDAYPGRTFEAEVTALRSAPVIVQNVVSYDAVLEVDNGDRSLRPGMTASVKVETASSKDAVLVPNAALRFTPPEAEGEPESRVWTLENDELVPVLVTPGVSDGRVTAVGAGEIEPGREVVVGLTEQGRAAYGASDEE